MQRKPGGINSYDRQAMPLSSRTPPQNSASRSDRRNDHDEYRTSRPHDRHFRKATRYSPPRAKRNRSRSRSRSPWRPDRERSRSPFRAERSPPRSRSRSRSPSRAHEARIHSLDKRPSLQGEKRGRDTSHYGRDSSDPRRFKTYYEKDVSFPVTPKYSAQQTQNNVNRETNIAKSRGGHDDGTKDKSRNGDQIRRKNGNVRSDQNRGDGSENETGEVSDKRSQSPAQENALAAAKPVLTEAELIEQRRKRRAELKARLLNEPALSTTEKVQHPVVHALKQSDLRSAPSTPLHDSSRTPSEKDPASPAAESTTPHRDTTPASPAPFVNNDAADMVSHHRVEVDVDQDDGPSAADYDPNQDMQDDQRRQSKAEDHAHTSENDAVSKQKEFDMFADEEEDDMFAPGFDVGRGAAADKPVDASMVEDYPDGHYRVVLGELLDHRYNVKQQIGKGTFATVVRAEDVRTNQLVAIKIACNNDTMYKAGQKETDMLAILNESDPDDRRHIIRLERQFMHKKHLCLVFENLGADLRETLRRYGRNRGINLTAIRSYAQQMFLALSHLKKCNILHADLKPDNILVSETLGLLKICDLGTAAMADQFLDITPYLVSRFYRAPEVILGIPFEFSIDMWSIGCTLFELYTGRILFTGADNNQMLRAIQECRGKIPIRLLKKGRAVDRHFDANANFVSYEVDDKTGKQLIKLLPMNKTVPGKDLRARLNSHMQRLTPEQQKEHMLFVDLLDRCLQLDPAKRVTPNDALRHEFVHGATIVRGSN